MIAIWQIFDNDFLAPFWKCKVDKKDAAKFNKWQRCTQAGTI